MRSADWRYMLASAALCTAIGIGGAAIAAAPSESDRSAGLSCRIDVSHAGGMLRLQAIGRAEDAASGRYRFSISKRNAAGSTANQQSGSFTLAPDAEKVLATVMLEAAAEGHFSARLTLDTGTGETVCQVP